MMIGYRVTPHGGDPLAIDTYTDAVARASDSEPIHVWCDGADLELPDSFNRIIIWEDDSTMTSYVLDRREYERLEGAELRLLEGAPTLTIDRRKGQVTLS